ncbi:hypothetical protein F5Y15DRAFT_420909 [Xylariaceae sp. FL0016]|nr:hypothetical protein F5Y15DRAFT_420909 [Xylariaceae sp. FL0016]
MFAPERRPSRAVTPIQVTNDGTVPFIRPYAYPRNRPQVKIEDAQPHGKSDQQVPMATTSYAEVATAETGIMAELKVSLAAKQLADQVSESGSIWRGLREKYELEVKYVKVYAGNDVLHQIWHKRVAYHSRSSSKGSEDVGQLSRQIIKLEVCVDQLGEAIKLILDFLISNSKSSYTSQQYEWGKHR